MTNDEIKAKIKALKVRKLGLYETLAELELGGDILLPAPNPRAVIDLIDTRVDDLYMVMQLRAEVGA